MARHGGQAGQDLAGVQLRQGQTRPGLTAATARQAKFAIRFAARRAGSLARVRMQLETERFLAKNRGDLEWAMKWHEAVQAIAQIEREMKCRALDEPPLDFQPAEPARLERMRLEEELREREATARRHIRGVLRQRRAANASLERGWRSRGGSGGKPERFFAAWPSVPEAGTQEGAATALRMREPRDGRRGSRRARNKSGAGGDKAERRRATSRGSSRGCKRAAAPALRRVLRRTLRRALRGAR